MTLRRTIQRREKRKRAKARPKPRGGKGISLQTVSAIATMALKRFEANLKFSELTNRRYDR